LTKLNNFDNILQFYFTMNSISLALGLLYEEVILTCSTAAGTAINESKSELLYKHAAGHRKFVT
jgi:hypothetical protein